VMLSLGSVVGRHTESIALLQSLVGTRNNCQALSLAPCVQNKIASLRYSVPEGQSATPYVR